MSRTCWSCNSPLQNGDIICPNCQHIQPPVETNPFLILGLEPSMHVNTAHMNASFFALQRKVHPDRFMNKAVQEQHYAQAHTIALNDALKALQSPSERLKAIAHLLDQPWPDPLPKPPMAFLSTMMSVQEKLAQNPSPEEKGGILSMLNTQMAELIAQCEKAFHEKSSQMLYENLTTVQYLEKLMGRI